MESSPGRGDARVPRDIIQEGTKQGVAEVIVVRPDGTLNGGCDRREPDGAVVRPAAPRE